MLASLMICDEDSSRSPVQVDLFPDVSVYGLCVILLGDQSLDVVASPVIYELCISFRVMMAPKHQEF